MVMPPSRLQVVLQPAYGLTVHKMQSMTVPWRVLGCLEGIFAAGMLHVQVSRVVNPSNFAAIGLPPADLLKDVQCVVLIDKQSDIKMKHSQNVCCPGFENHGT